MDEVTRGVWPFMIAQFAVMFLLVFFPSLVLVPARWFYGWILGTHGTAAAARPQAGSRTAEQRRRHARRRGV